MTLEATVWRNYSQPELDIQYNSRGTVPDFGIYLRDYAARTANAKANLVCHENLSYEEAFALMARSAAGVA